MSLAVPFGSTNDLDDVVERLRALPADEAQLFLRSLDPGELEAVEEALTRVEAASAEWRDTPTTMAHHLTKGQVRLYRYSQLLGEKFKDAVEGRSKRQIWNLPPRYGKSMIASQWGPAWALDRYPWLKLILSSYADHLAVENAIAVREILRQYRGDLRAQLRRDRQQQDRFVTTEGGGVLAAGIMASITGFGAHGVVFDDPFKDWQEAHSQQRRDLVDNQFKAVLLSRLESEDAFVIVPMTRWHEDDQAARLQDRMLNGTGAQYEVVRLPEIAEPYDPHSLDPLLRVPDPLGREPGEPLEPSRFSLRSVEEKHLEMGSYLTAAMFQQRPAPEEGGEIKRAWFRLDDNVPADADEWIASWDMKLKEKETGDWVVGQTWGRTGSSYWLKDQLRGQWNQPTVENAIALAQVREPRIRTQVIENTGNGPEVMQSLRESKSGYVISDEVADLLGMNADERVAVQELRRRGMSNLVAENVKGSKVVRMRAQSGLIEAGNVHVWSRAKFLGTFLDEVASFPNGAHDDQVDAMSQALKRLRGGTAVAKAASGTIPKTPISEPNARVSTRSRGTVELPRFGR